MVRYTGLAALFCKGNMNEELAPKKKIHSRNEFELCYLRHQYLRKVKDMPSQAEMQPYMRIVEHMARNTFYTYKNLFLLVGFELEDVINVSTVHLVSFLGLFSMDNMGAKYESFLEAHKTKYGFYPDDQSLLNKNKANLTLFLKQRMEDLVRVCRQKARNIKGLPVEEFYVFYGAKRYPKNLRKLLEDHEKFGYRKLDMASFKSIKKKANKKGTEPFKFDGKWYVPVLLEQKTLTALDFAGAGMNPYDSIHNKDPEQLLFEKQDEEQFERRKDQFFNSSKQRQVAILRSFIRKNVKNPLFREEIKIARKVLKGYVADVR